MGTITGRLCANRHFDHLYAAIFNEKINQLNSSDQKRAGWRDQIEHDFKFSECDLEVNSKPKTSYTDAPHY